MAVAGVPARADDDDAFDPATVDIADAIACKLDAPQYNGFALSLQGTDGIAAARGWRLIEQSNPFLNEYELPAPIAVVGRSTRRIGFTASAIVAILDLPDPSVVAAPEQIRNELDAAMEEIAAAAKAADEPAPAARGSFRKFLGERVLVDETEPAADRDSYGTHTVIARSISNTSTHPGKTFYGCSYRIEMIDADGAPL